MKENEEITNLERFELLIEDCKGHRELYGESFVGEYDIEIMQHILSDYKRVLKENEELKNDYENLSNSVVVKNYYIENSIPVQKVKDKIEELNRKIDKSIDNSKGGLDEEFIEKAGELLTQKRILQELLEGRE